MLEHDMPFSDYARAPGINASALKAGRTSMLHMQNAVCGKPKPPTQAMRNGTLIHAAILEPDLLAEQLLVVDARRNTKAYKEAAEGHDESFIVTSEQHADLFAVSAAVHGNRDAHRLIADTQHEVSCFWESDRYGKCKARFDGFGERVGLVEVKTTGIIEPRRCMSNFESMGYPIQLGWYWSGAVCETGDTSLPCHVIAIEQKPPHDVVVYRVPTSVLKAGLEEAEEIAMRWRIAQTTGVFPGVESEVVDYERPAWACDEPEIDMEGVE